jgi:hypothetical protein
MEQRDTGSADTTSQLSNGNAAVMTIPSPARASDGWRKLRDLRRRLAPAGSSARPVCGACRP